MAYSRLFSEAVQGFPSFGSLKEDECLEQKQQWFCKEAKYGIIYVGTLNLSSLPKNILPPSDCINRAEEVEWEFTETVKVCNECLRMIYPLDVLGKENLILLIFSYISYFCYRSSVQTFSCLFFA